MSLCEACRKPFPSIPASERRKDATVGVSEIQSEHGNWCRSPFSRSGDKWYLRDPFPLHASWESLVISLSHDCPICWTLWRYIRSSPIASPSNERIAGFKAEITDMGHDADSPQYSVHIRLMGHSIERKEFVFIIQKTTEKCYLEAEREFPLAVQHTPRSAADVANRWIKTCEAKHSRCSKQAAPPEHARMPTRLLDLGDVNSNAWRLYQDPAHVPYAALSHRWASDTPELHTGNYQNYCNFQPDSTLPQNYQDIISICRAIPIQYLWIDSLCIIQNDNGHEFSKEAPLMRDIYQYAVLTLSICWNFHGCSIFRRCRPRSIPRPRPRPRPLDYDRKHDCGSVSDQWVFAEEKMLMELKFHVSGAPINQRAWVLQERCLSRRLLYLGNDQLYWECDGCTGSEASPGDIRSDGGRQSILDLTGHDRDAAWSWLLTQYTGSSLTFESDRLVAIAGLAKLIASKTGGTYVAGIWIDSWMQDLLWQPVEERDRSPKLKPVELAMVLPSWSWLGFSGSVASGIMTCGEGPKISPLSPNSFRSDLHQPLALLSQVVVIPPTSDPYSFFERAILKIRCLLLPVTFAGRQPADEQEWFFLHEYNVNLTSVGLDCLLLRACGPSDDKFAAFTFCFSKPVDMSLQYFLLPLYLGRNPGPKSYCVYGLALQRGPSEANEEYTRIGMWKEDFKFSSQLSPMISNTIIRLGIGQNSNFNDRKLTEDERVFDSRLGEYAVGHVVAKVQFPMKVDKRGDERQPAIEEVDEKTSTTGSEATEQEPNEMGEEEEGSFVRDEEVECSLLPHFTTAEWGTISLV